MGPPLSAGGRCPAYEESVIANDVTAETVSPVRHWRQGCPAVGVGIVGFVFRKGMVGWQFAPKHQDQAVIIRAGKATPRRRQRRPGGPFVGRRIVDVMLVGAFDGALQASTDSVNFSVGSNDDHMVTRRRQRCRLGPAMRLRIKNLMSSKHDTVEAAAADYMDFAIHGRGTSRPT